ncbi:13326_t:CDS:2, partial [Gigaspora rosea]
MAAVKVVHWHHQKKIEIGKDEYAARCNRILVHGQVEKDTLNTSLQELLGELLKRKKRRYNLACGLIGGREGTENFSSVLYLQRGQDSSGGSVMGPDVKQFPPTVQQNSRSMGSI